MLWAQLSPERDRRTHLPWGGMWLEVAGCRYQGRSNTSSSSRGQQPFPAKGSPLEGKQKHKQATPTPSSPSEKRVLFPCSGQCSAGPRMPLGTGHLPPCQENPCKAFSSCSNEQDEQLVHRTSDG